jgi:hypothetical protein
VGRLPDLVAGGLAPDEQKAVADHLSRCPDCRRAVAELRAVSALLKAAPAPAVRVDLPALYRAAAERQARLARRWRRLAVASAASAAALLVAALGLRLEVRAEGHQVVVRWGPSPAPSAPPVAPPPAPATSEPAPDETRRLTELVLGLANEGDQREERYRQELARLRGQLRLMQRQATEHRAAAEQDLDALYASQFPTPKGDKQ